MSFIKDSGYTIKGCTIVHNILLKEIKHTSLTVSLMSRSGQCNSCSFRTSTKQDINNSRTESLQAWSSMKKGVAYHSTRHHEHVTFHEKVGG